MASFAGPGNGRRSASRESREAGGEDLLGADPSVFVLVSCDPSSFARDAALLGAAGFELDRWTVVDLFPGTSHVETVARFTR